MADLGKAYVQIVASAEGIDGQVNSVLGSAMSTAGTNSGQKFNLNFGSVLSSFVVPGAILGAVVGIGKAGLEAAAEVEAGFNNVITATGATGEAAESLREVYENVATDVVGDFEDIGAAVGELNTMLGLQGTELEIASEQAMKYAKINGQDVVTAIDDVTQLMNNAGISADQFSTILDELTVAAQASGIDVGKLATVVNQNMSTFDAMGLSVEDAVAMLANFEKTGANTTSILAGMKKGVANWTKEGKSAKEGFAEFVAGVQDGSITSAEAIELFGSKSGMDMYNAALKGQLSFEEMYAAIEESSGSVDEVYSDTLTNSEKIGTAWQGVKVACTGIFQPIADGATYVISEVLLPILTTAITGVSEFISGVIGFFSNLDENMTAIWETIVGAATSAWESVTSAITAPIEACSAWLEEIWSSITSVASTAWENAVTAVSDAWSGVKSAVSAPITAIESWLSEIWTSICSVASEAWTSIQDAITAPISAASEVISGIVEGIKGFFSFTFEWPSIPLPHFGIEPEGWVVGDLLKGVIPKLGISWYAEGGIVDGATLIGAGEKGPEAIVPLDQFWDRLENSGQTTIYITNNIDGAENPEDYARRLVKEIRREMRMA